MGQLHQKYRNLCSEDKLGSFGFGTIYDRISIFGMNYPFKLVKQISMNDVWHSGTTGQMTRMSRNNSGHQAALIFEPCWYNLVNMTTSKILWEWIPPHRHTQKKEKYCGPEASVRSMKEGNGSSYRRSEPLRSQGSQRSADPPLSGPLIHPC